MIAVRAEVIARHSINALHRWPDAPDGRDYLRSAHQHRFRLEVRVEVGGELDRQVEFHDLRDHLIEAVREIAMITPRGVISFGAMSCEQIGQSVLGRIPEACRVSVWEDAEHGAEVYRT